MGMDCAPPHPGLFLKSPASRTPRGDGPPSSPKQTAKRCIGFAAPVRLVGGRPTAYSLRRLRPLSPRGAHGGHASNSGRTTPLSKPGALRARRCLSPSLSLDAPDGRAAEKKVDRNRLDDDDDGSMMLALQNSFPAPPFPALFKRSIPPKVRLSKTFQILRSGPRLEINLFANESSSRPTTLLRRINTTLHISETTNNLYRYFVLCLPGSSGRRRRRRRRRRFSLSANMYRIQLRTANKMHTYQPLLAKK